MADRSILEPAALPKDYGVNYATHFAPEFSALKKGSVDTQLGVEGTASGAARRGTRKLVNPSSQHANTARVALEPLPPTIFVVVIAG